jgi:serine phosphatase RsbU (regulator of sigma subunit)
MDRDREIREMYEREQRHDRLIARLRLEAGAREHDLAELRDRLGAAEHELEGLRAIRNALTPPELPARPGVDLQAGFLPAAERVSGDFNLVAEGPQDATILVVGDVAGHGVVAARRAAFTRTTFGRDGTLLRRSLSPARLGQRRAHRARQPKRRLRHRRMCHVAALGAPPALGLRRPSAGTLA